MKLKGEMLQFDDNTNHFIRTLAEVTGRSVYDAPGPVYEMWFHFCKGMRQQCLIDLPADLKEGWLG